MYNKIYWNITKNEQNPEVLLVKGVWKYAADLQENTHAEVWFQQSCKATLLKLQFGMGFLL